MVFAASLHAVRLLDRQGVSSIVVDRVLLLYSAFREPNILQSSQERIRPTSCYDNGSSLSFRQPVQMTASHRFSPECCNCTELWVVGCLISSGERTGRSDCRCCLRSVLAKSLRCCNLHGRIRLLSWHVYVRWLRPKYTNTRGRPPCKLQDRGCITWLS